MIKYFIYICLFVGICYSQITRDGITINSFELSNTILNRSTSIDPSATWILGVTSSKYNLSSLQGSFIFYYEYYYEKFDFYPTLNFFNQTEDQVYISVCLSAVTFQYCEIGPAEPNIICNYNILFYPYPTSYGVVFSNDDLVNAFPGALLQVVQNTVPPVLNSLKVNIHPQGNLLSFVFDVSNYGKSITQINVQVNGIFGDPDDYSFVTVDNFHSIDGFYYAEQIVQPDCNMYIVRLGIYDFEGNSVYYNRSQLLSKFGIGNFSTPKSSSPINYQDIYSSSLNNASNIAYNNQTTLISYTIDLVAYNYPIISKGSNLGNCVTYYQNSTTVSLYCDILPYLHRNYYDDQVYFSAASQYDSKAISYLIDYKTLNDSDITISDIVFTYNEINGFENFYMETNFTFESPDSYLYSLSARTNNSYTFADIDLSSLVSGNLSFGVVSVTWLFEFDSNLNTYRIFADNSLFNYIDINPIGPINNPSKSVKNDIELTLSFDSRVFDFTNASIFTLPFTVSTNTQAGDNLVRSSLEYASGYSNSQSLSNNFFSDIFGGLLNSVNGSSLYQSWVSLTSDYFLNSLPYNGDYNLKYNYKSVYGDDDKEIFLSDKCFTVIARDMQLTMVTSLSMSPSNIVNSMDTIFVIISFDTKGDDVEGASINIYGYDKYEYRSEEQEFECIVATPYNYETMITSFNCSIPVESYPTQTIYYYIKLSIVGVEALIYNYQLQENGFPSYIQINGPSDNGLVPQIATFQTSLNTSSNIIFIEYSIDNQSPFELNQVDFIIFDTIQNIDYIVYSVYGLNDSFSIDLCELEGFSPRYQNIGIFISIPSPVLKYINYQIPYEILKAMDKNNQDLPVQIFGVCDYQGPRVIDFGILDYDTSDIDTTNGDYNITLYADITDDVSGFVSLSGTVKSNGTDNFLNGPFYITLNDIVSGNRNNGRYQVNFTIPQYTVGTYLFSIINVMDSRTNVRPYTQTNTMLLANGKPYYFNAVSQVSNPASPSLISVTNSYSNEANNIQVQVQGNVQSVYLLFTFIDGYQAIDPTTNPNLYQLSNFNPQIDSGIYYFSLCLTSSSLSQICYSYTQLSTLGFDNSVLIYNPY